MMAMLTPFNSIIYHSQVKVILGESRELVGTLISIDGVDGVMKTEQGDIKMLQLRMLCKAV